MTICRAKWPLGTEARLMFDILHYTFLRLGDAYRFGPLHLRQIVRKMAKAAGVALAGRRSCQSELEHGDTTARELPSSMSSRPPMRSRCLSPSCLSRAAHAFTST
jgi:hypothetical protein